MVRCRLTSNLVRMSNVLLLKVPAAPCYSKCTVERNDFTIRCRCVQPTLELCFIAAKARVS